VLKIIHKFKVPFKVFILRFLQYWIFYFKIPTEIRVGVLTTYWPPNGSINFKLSFKFKFSFRDF
jgi:hypothetical protein